MATHHIVRGVTPWHRLAASLLLLALAACSDDKLTEASDPAGAVAELAQGGKKLASLTISPDSASVAPGLAARFSVKGVRRDGSTVPVTVTWAATGGTITSSGLYTAGTSVGSFRVIAKTATLADSATVRISATAPTVTSLVVTPASDTLPPGATQKFVATGRLSDGSTTPVPVKWAATGGTIDTAGVYTAGSATGSYRVIAVQTAGTLADTVAVRIVAQAPPPTLGCLNQSGPTVTISGLQRISSTAYYTSLADNTKLDASTAQLLSTANQGVSMAGGSSVCTHGGQIAGSWSPATPWETMHDTYAVVARLPSLTFENFQVFAYGDGITLDAQSASNWTIRGVHFKYIRDDCVENDFLNSGLIDDSFFDGCYSGLSARHYTTTQDGSNNVVVVQNSLWRASEVDPAGAYRNVGGNIGFFKWDAIGPKIKLYNNVYRADGPATFSDQPLMPPANKLVDCSGNVMVWLGSGPFPEPLPSCYTLMTGQAGLDYWNNAVARWRAAHPSTLADAVAPIIALRSPASGATLSGTVTLTATAVDDQDMAGVQFKLNGQAIGSEVTTEAPITKFRLSWDSRGKPNGSYTLTATGRDAAGNTRTSTGVTVTISN